MASDITSLARALTPAMDMWQSRLAGIVNKVEVEAKDKGTQDALKYVKSHLDSNSDSDSSLRWLGQWQKKPQESISMNTSKQFAQKEIRVNEDECDVKGALDGVCVEVGNDYSQDEEDVEMPDVLPELTQGMSLT